MRVQVLHVAYVVTLICMWLQYKYVLQAVMANEVATQLLFAVLLCRPVSVFLLGALIVGSTFERSLGLDDFPDLSVTLIGVIFPVFCAVLSQKVMELEARATVAASTSASSEAAVKDLLDIRDAVVVLDEHLVIAAHCPRLDALLLRRAP